MNLFLTEDGVLKLGYYGLTTQAECYGIKKTECEGVRSFAPEVFRGGYEMKSDVWSFGIALLEMMGITPYYWYKYNRLPTMSGDFKYPFDELNIKSYQLTDFLRRCFQKYDRWSVNELINVSVMGWRMTSSIHLRRNMKENC